MLAPAAERAKCTRRPRIARDHERLSCCFRDRVRLSWTCCVSAAKEAPMSGGSAKQKVLEAIEKLPADATLEDAIERLVILAKIDRGLAELDAGQGIDPARRRVAFSGDPSCLGASMIHGAGDARGSSPRTRPSWITTQARVRSGR